MTQNGTQYTLDLNAGLTQVLDDGTNTYTYGLGRISQTNSETEYFLGDALGSVRQMTNSTGEMTYTQSYTPYGTSLSSAGDSETPYGFTGEYTDSTGNIYLRARYYNPSDGRFLSRDTWAGDVNNPLSLNKWNYTHANPVNYTDPSGHCAGFKGLNAASSAVMSFTALGIGQFGKNISNTVDLYKDAYNTCVDSLQKAGSAFGRGDYGRALAYASGTTSAFQQMSDRMAQLNHNTDVIFSECYSFGDKFLAWLDWGMFGLQASLAITPGVFAIKGFINNTYLGGLSVGVPDEFLSPMQTGLYRNWSQAEQYMYLNRTPLNQNQVLQLRQVAINNNCTFGICGGWAETPNGLRNRYYGIQYEGYDIPLEPFPTAPRDYYTWRNTGLPTYNKDLDIWTPGGVNLNQNIVDDIANVIYGHNTPSSSLTVDNYFKSGWNTEPPGLIFNPDGIVVHNLGPWQIPFNWNKIVLP